MESLKQKKFHYYRNYSFVPEGVKLEFKIEEGYFAQTVKFEETGFDELINETKPSAIKVGLVLSIMFNIMLLYWYALNSGINSDLLKSTVIIPIVLAGFLAAFLKSNHMKYIIGIKQIPFWYDKKYSSEVDSFISEIKKAKREYMRNKHLKVEESEELFVVKNRLNWLRKEDFITEDELKEHLLQLETRKIIKGYSIE